jgi:hypothetical protein
LDQQEREQSEKERRLTSSHYGFFARSLPPQTFSEFGHFSTRDFWKKMAAKEKRELGRRTMLKHKKDELPASATHQRLPALPPQSSHESNRAATKSSSSAVRERSLCRQKTASILELSSTKVNAPTEAKNQETRSDICDGLRVIILKEPPKDIRGDKTSANERQRFPPTVEESLKVYRRYQELLQMEVALCEDPDANSLETEAELQEGKSAQQRQSRMPHANGQALSKELMPISWPTYLGWVQRECDFADHFRYKSVCLALLRALQRWQQWQASPLQKHHGVSLNMMFQWMFPNLAYQDMLDILKSIALHELEHITQPTPPVMESVERRLLESIFHSLDGQGRGFCTAEDIAGGERQDVASRLKNVVDAATVKLVCGEKPLDQTNFLEMMCEDNFRAHSDSKIATLVDETGGIFCLKEETHEILGYKGWVHAVASKEEEAHRRLISAIEAEVKRWMKMMSDAKKTLLDEVQVKGQIVF